MENESTSLSTNSADLDELLQRSPKQRTLSRTQTLLGTSAEDIKLVREMDKKVAKKLLEEE